MEALTKVLLMVIPIAVLIIALWIFLSPGKGFDALKDVVEATEEYVPDISLEGDKLEDSNNQIPPEQVESINSLKEAFQKVLDSTNKNCFLNYGGLVYVGGDVKRTEDLLAESRGTSIRLIYENGITKVLVFGGTGGQKLIADLTRDFEDMIPCVIAGTEEITDNFDKNFLNGQGSNTPYFKRVDLINIASEFKIDGENKIDFGTGFQDFEGHKWLFSPDNKHICFFPTFDGDIFGNCDGNDVRGLDNDCLIDESEAVSIPYKFARGELEACNAQNYDPPAPQSEEESQDASGSTIDGGDAAVTG